MKSIRGMTFCLIGFWKEVNIINGMEKVKYRQNSFDQFEKSDIALSSNPLWVTN